ncbi:Transmembrane 9 superfamily member [Thalictrum thalictroides]|uniref:Transmembrane 9 superfamily member n=1 Tax=Thalictrum thalictroides TaxID=46969 RepID=A0A7J6WJT5_THATH|nr:Transmembrane 9 superfamily member [Thalictrum thalictroides]
METICWKLLKSKDIAQFRDAVKNNFFFQMYYDDLPFWGFVGKVEQEVVLYNGNQVIEINALSDPNYTVDITEDTETIVDFTYSVSWNATSIDFVDRMGRYLRSSLVSDTLQIHWYSIINSIVIVVLLAGMLSTLFIETSKMIFSSTLTKTKRQTRRRLVGSTFMVMYSDILRTYLYSVLSWGVVLSF